ncbi:MAG: Hint domain-containing protein [Pseudomonadota bacterium]
MNALTKIREPRPDCLPSQGLTAKATLRTPCGGRRMENIRKGDLIVTRDNGLQPVRMVWTRTVTEAEIAADPALAPVCLIPRAIGPMMPQRELSLAGGHRILVPGYRLADVPDTESSLIPAHSIAEASDDAYVEKVAGEVTYYNIVFDAHQVFAADGLPVESYRPTQESLAQLDAPTVDSLFALFPDLGRKDAAFPTAGYRVPEMADYRPEFV